MSPTEFILALAICFLGAVLFFGSRRLLKNRAAEIDRREAQDPKKAAVGAITYPLGGLALIGVMLFNWSRIPPENIGFAIGFIVLAVALMGYGFYRWYKIRRSELGKD